MKKTLFFGLMAAALGFTACSSDDDLSVNNSDKKGMVLRATVEQPTETRATITDNEGVWYFAFATGDKVSVTNTAITDTYYTFTNGGTQFKSEDAEATETDATWYAYFPSNTIDLTNQSGTKDDVANKYALAGATTTTGKEGLNITMSPKVAILVIDNQKGSIDINVKSSATDWVSGLAANADGFTVSTATSKQSLLNATATGTYYVAVPAGVQLAVKDGDKTIKSTGTNGLTAGKYYNLTLIGYGKAYAKGPNCNVNWVQLWDGGPKFAEFNVGAAYNKAEDYGGYYHWGGSEDKGWDYNKDLSNLSGDSDTATKLWGSNWRMPTKAELEALRDNCNVEWTAVGGVNGLLCTGKGDYSSNSVFLPAAGNGSENQGTNGYYWSSTMASSNQASSLGFHSGSNGVSSSYRYTNYSVRAVLKEQKE